jgi:hypothetical protein
MIVQYTADNNGYRETIDIDLISKVTQLRSIIAKKVGKISFHRSDMRVRFPMRSLNFSIYLTFQPRYGPGVDSAANRNEYQESSWE